MVILDSSNNLAKSIIVCSLKSVSTGLLSLVAWARRLVVIIFTIVLSSWELAILDWDISSKLRLLSTPCQHKTNYNQYLSNVLLIHTIEASRESKKSTKKSPKLIGEIFSS